MRQHSREPHDDVPIGDDIRTSVGRGLTELRLAVLGISPLAFRDLAQAAKWPERRPPIQPMKDLREAVARLRYCGFLTVERGAVDYGDETCRIAAEWEIEIGAKEPAAD